MKSKDDQVRGAAIRISSKGMKPSRLRGPIQALILLEIHDAGDGQVEETNDVECNQTEESTAEERRPGRRAAVN